jgi:hypothetical protein
MTSLLTRVKDTLRHGWNAFRDENYLDSLHVHGGGNLGYYASPSRNRLSFSNERSIISSIYTRLSIDVSNIDFRHVRTDSEGRYLNDINSGLQDCLQVDPNIDQGPDQFFRDIAMTTRMFPLWIPEESTSGRSVSGKWSTGSRGTFVSVCMTTEKRREAYDGR